MPIGPMMPDVERVQQQTEADSIAAVRKSSGWTGMYFGGTAFKKQRPVEITVSRRSESGCGYMDAVTTSGIATGHPADLEKSKPFATGSRIRRSRLPQGLLLTTWMITWIWQMRFWWLRGLIIWEIFITWIRTSCADFLRRFVTMLRVSRRKNIVPRPVARMLIGT